MCVNCVEVPEEVTVPVTFKVYVPAGVPGVCVALPPPQEAQTIVRMRQVPEQEHDATAPVP